jgi:hypothetical protein
MSDKNKEPDLTVVVYGKDGAGKSALIGEIADFLLAHQCKVKCFQGPNGGKKQFRPEPPPPGRFHPRPLRVKLVEQWGEKEGK